MKLTFFSNFLNHHQLPLCLALQRRLGPDFCFVATTPFNAGAVSTGYRDMNLDYDFCLQAYRSEAAANKAKEIGWKSDVVLSGGVADSWISGRIGLGRLTFRVSERPLKPLYASLSNPLTRAAMMWRNTRYKKKPLYLLACGAHTTEDFARVKAYDGKAFKWGYFPEVPDEMPLRAPRHKDEPLRLLWAGRMIGWKHPARPLALVRALNERGIPCQLRYLGEGELYASVKQRAGEMGLDGQVAFEGARSPEEVRARMQEADIFLFTSDENEGWGAVLNEAMAAGCAVLASSRAGATGYLVQDGINGAVYDGSEAAFVEKGLALAADAESRAALADKGFNTLRTLWNGEVAAGRLLELCEGLLAGDAPEFDEGPCSRA